MGDGDEQLGKREATRLKATDATDQTRSSQVEGHAYVIQVDDDIEGRGRLRGVVAADEGRLQDILGTDGGVTGARVLPDDNDVEGHIAASTVAVRLQTDNDVEGHAITLKFPSPADAAAFRRRLVLTGALAATVATVALGIPGATTAGTWLDPSVGIVDALVQPTEETDRGREGVGLTRIR
jgi:hypothetical protein